MFHDGNEHAIENPTELDRWADEIKGKDLGRYQVHHTETGAHPRPRVRRSHRRDLAYGSR
jgi:hypothetical protein